MYGLRNLERCSILGNLWKSSKWGKNLGISIGRRLFSWEFFGRITPPCKIYCSSLQESTLFLMIWGSHSESLLSFITFLRSSRPSWARPIPLALFLYWVLLRFEESQVARGFSSSAPISNWQEAPLSLCYFFMFFWSCRHPIFIFIAVTVWRGKKQGENCPGTSFERFCRPGLHQKVLRIYRRVLVSGM